MQAGNTVEGGDEAAVKDKDHDRRGKKGHGGGINGREQQLVVSDLLAADCKKVRLHPEWEDKVQRWYGCSLQDMKKKDEEKRNE